MVSFPPLINMLKFSGYSTLTRGRHWIVGAGLETVVAESLLSERLDRHAPPPPPPPPHLKSSTLPSSTSVSSSGLTGVLSRGANRGIKPTRSPTTLFVRSLHHPPLDWGWEPRPAAGATDHLVKQDGLRTGCCGQSAAAAVAVLVVPEQQAINWLGYSFHH